MSIHSKITRALTATLFASLLATSAWSNPFTGKVVYVDDGDTVVMLVDGNTRMKIRLSSIDAPEYAHTNKNVGRIGQPYSIKSGQYLALMVKGKPVQANCFEADKYGREVCELFIDGQSVNKEMVKQGWAWANAAAHGRYLRDKSLPSIEATARASHIGLWSGLKAVPPWEWRSACWQRGECGE